MKLMPTSTNPVTITLYRNYPFDNSYKETCLLSTSFRTQSYNVGADKNAFLDLRKSTNNQFYFPRTTKTGTYNFAFGNGLVTSLILELTDEEINTNYIKVECTSTREVYYYFVTKITQKNESTYMLNLELDIFMTYGEEFLTTMNNKPVMTERKHCFRVDYDGLPCTSDLTRGDKYFAGVKANIIEDVKKLELDIPDVDNTKLKNYNWCYVISKIRNELIDYGYKENGIYHSYIVYCFPMVSLKYYRVVNGVNTLWKTIEPYDQMKVWSVNDNIYKITILPYPPFKDLGTNKILSQTDDELSLLIDENNITSSSSSIVGIDIDSDKKTKFEIVTLGQLSTIPNHILLTGYGGEINYQDITLFEDNGDIQESRPTISMGKDYGEYKLYLPPFREYKLRSYADDGIIVHPELRFNHIVDSNWRDFSPITIISSNPDNTSYFTTLQVQDGDIKDKNGLGTTYYYSLPTSYTALQHFLNTASAEYNNSKLISGINSIASIGLGAGVLGFGKGPLRKIAGAGAIVGGIIKEVDNITSNYAKMEDLKNTPANLTTGGSTFTLDYAMALSTNMYMLPYVAIYKVDDSTFKCGSDFFYRYGYEVNRECFFNINLSARVTFNDSKLFTRQIFNYIKLSEDISDKLIALDETNSPSGIPLVVAQKFGEVFLDGITIWNFFDFTTLQTKINNEHSVYNVFKYFRKSNYCNAEFNIGE